VANSPRRTGIGSYAKTYPPERPRVPGSLQVPAGRWLAEELITRAEESDLKKYCLFGTLFYVSRRFIRKAVWTAASVRPSVLVSHRRTSPSPVTGNRFRGTLRSLLSSRRGQEMAFPLANKEVLLRSAIDRWQPFATASLCYIHFWGTSKTACSGVRGDIMRLTRTTAVCICRHNSATFRAP